ncbi:hypothetical protein CGC56_09175 [Capnocytophaga canimorsus]|uniref:DUF4595 domain-containing protein n=1 Tax=Capnocytophaga canimorsus TaxID=28188 RepID=A0A250G4I0_9FLAO|nr:hypothetical protein [Capnocytophaga canimorsus]ATA92312.1 hypothetical protein CGC56_09175 [Capnocytophaga canimorsus]
MKRFILSLFTLSLIVSCSKDNNNGEQPNQETMLLPKQVVERYTITERDQNGVETKIEHVEEVNYEIVGNKVVGGTFNFFKNNKKEGSSKFTYTYENDLLKTSVHVNLKTNEEDSRITCKYENRKLVEKVEEWLTNSGKNSSTNTYKYSGDKLIEKQVKNNWGSDESIKTSKFVYVSPTEIKKIETIPYIINGQEMTRTKTTTYTLDTERRVIKSVEEREDSKITKEFQYDDKKNYKHHLIALATEPDHFLDEEIMKNNLISVKRTYENKQNSQYNETETSTYSYQYNDKGYPTRIEEVHKENDKVVQESTVEITYY